MSAPPGARPGGDPSSTAPDQRPGLAWIALLAALSRLPQGALSRVLGRVADVPIPERMRAAVLGRFARIVGIDVNEAELPLTEYGTLNRFFVRRLRTGVRTWPEDPGVVTSPVDGVVGAFGTIRDGTLVQAKGLHYTASDLLGDSDCATRYDGGSYLTIYLSPRHYHRIHAPCTGEITTARHVPGSLMPVNEPAVGRIDRLFPRNERLLCTIASETGDVVVVAVGAYNVGRISAAFDVEWNGGLDGWITNRGAGHSVTRRYEPAVPVSRGEEIMAFHLGSTIVMLLDAAHSLDAGLDVGAEIRLGEAVAR